MTFQTAKATAMEKKQNAITAFKSWENFKSWLRVPDTALDRHSHEETAPTWSNEDLDPTPPEKRTWRWYNYVLFYFALSFGNWTLGSSLIGIGLNYWQAILAIFISQFISSVVMLFNSRCASVYHVGYPIVARSVFGMWGSYYFVGARAVLAVIWFGVQTFSGASLVASMLRAIFGHNFTDIKNTIPKSEGISSAVMLAFFLFWLAHFPLAMRRPYQLRTFFLVKTILMIPAVWGLFIFCMANTGGSLGTDKLSAAAGTGASGASAKWGWFFMNAINAGLGNTATLITHQPDIARWSKTRTGAMWSQLITNPLAVTLSASLGILSTAAINNAWGLSLWNQWDLLDAIMDRYWRSDVRFAVFLCAGCWAVSLLGTNVAANMIPFGADSSMLFPRYITIPRGQILVAFLGFAIVPWKILASAAVFTTFLAGYGLFMASVVAIMVCEYFCLTRGNLFIAHCYNGGKENPHYYYHKGWNVQAVIAYICGIALPFPGFIGSLGANVSTTALNMGNLGWMLSFTTSFIIYWAICTVWPTKNQKIIREMGLRFEEMAERDMMALDGTIIPESAEGMSEDQVVWDETEKKAVAFDSRRLSD